MIELNVWGTLLLLVLAALAGGLLWMTDRKLVPRMGRSVLTGVVQLVLMGLYVWALMQVDKVWLSALWLLLMAAALAWLIGRRIKPKELSPFVMVVTAALFVGCGVPALCLSWCLPGRLFVPVTGVLLGMLYVSAMQSVGAYLGSLRRTEEHRRYLLSCGATHLESLMPSIRRALRAAVLPLLQHLSSPLVVAMPALLGGLLLAGCEAPAAVVATLLTVLAGFIASVLTIVVFMVLADRLLFDKHQRFIGLEEKS